MDNGGYWGPYYLSNLGDEWHKVNGTIKGVISMEYFNIIGSPAFRYFQYPTNEEVAVPTGWKCPQCKMIFSPSFQGSHQCGSQTMVVDGQTVYIPPIPNRCNNCGTFFPEIGHTCCV